MEQPLKHQHQSDALAVTCIDYRFQKPLWEFLNSFNLSYDRVSLAGAGKNQEQVLEQLEISVRLHSIKQVFLIHHEDCGAYAGGGKEIQLPDMQQLKEKILQKYPYLMVELFFMRLDDIVEKLL